MNTITYTLENGTKIVQPINNQAFVNEKNRKRTSAEMHKLFAETAWDKRAVSYTIDSETDESVATEKELYFTKNEKKVAKRDYKEFQKSNPEGFRNSLKSFQKTLVDVVTKHTRIRMNITNIVLQ